jgi:polysaccharide biosynthesis protein PslH
VGGGYKRTLRTLEAMQRAGVRPHLLTTDPGEPGAVDVLRRRGFEVEVLPVAPATFASRADQKLRRLPSPHLSAVDERLRELVAEGVAFVQFDSTQSGYYFDAIAGTPAVLSIHNVDSQMLESVARDESLLSVRWARAWSRTLAMRSIERHAFPRADVVVCVSEADAAAVDGRARRVLVAPNGVDGSLFEISPEPPAEENVLFFGQYDYSPNAHGVLRFLRNGWPVLAAARPAARLRLVGKGAGTALEQAVAAAERVDLVGVVEDIGEELARSRITIAPIWQGGGTRLKVLESLGAARPVAGTSVGVEGTGFEDGRHGLVADDPAELASRAAELLEDSSSWRRMAAAGRELARTYAWERALEPLGDVYRTLASRPPRL